MRAVGHRPSVGAVAGHSLMVRVPKALADFLGAKAGRRVHLASLGPRRFSVELLEEAEG